MSEAAEAGPRRRALWPWLVLGAFLISVLAMRLLGAFVGFGVDEDDFQRRVLEDTVETLGVHKAHRQQCRMHRE